MSRAIGLVLLGLPLLGAPGCGDSGPTTFTSLKPTIATSCALSKSCHSAESTLGGGKRLDLQTDPWAALVGAATQAPAFPQLQNDYPTLVVGGNPDKSAVWVKFNLPVANDPKYGARMPQNSLPLDAATLASFRSWIANGALND